MVNTKVRRASKKGIDFFVFVATSNVQATIGHAGYCRRESQISITTFSSGPTPPAAKYRDSTEVSQIPQGSLISGQPKQGWSQPLLLPQPYQGLIACRRSSRSNCPHFLMERLRVALVTWMDSPGIIRVEHI